MREARHKELALRLADHHRADTCMRVHPAAIGCSALLLAGVLLAQVCAAAEVKTSKERLSGKATDEQRVDNCRVPPERRGSVPRPDCAGAGSIPPTERNTRPELSR
jgi:hypothetical protein